jgi:hypothetical protein
VIVSEQGWKAPISGGSISIVDVDTRAVRLVRKRTVWPAASATVSSKLVGDPECKAPPTDFSPHGLSVLERRSGIRLAIVNHGARESVELNSDGSATQRAAFAFRDLADDLHWTMRGTILVGGQVRSAPTQWSVAEIDRKAGRMRSLFEQRSEIHSVTTATDVGDGIVFGSTADQRIAIARWPVDTNRDLYIR